MTIEKLIKDRFDNMFLRNTIKIGAPKHDFFVSIFRQTSNISFWIEFSLHTIE